MLRGNQPATVDGKGRIRVPTSFRSQIQERWGDEFFLTSLDGNNVLAYPIPIWAEIEERIDRVPAMNPARQKFLKRVNYYGHVTSMDKQGRVLIPPLLRDSATIEGEVVVMGQINHLEIWNHELFRQRMEAAPLNDDDYQTLADLGI